MPSMRQLVRNYVRVFDRVQSTHSTTAAAEVIVQLRTLLQKNKTRTAVYATEGEKAAHNQAVARTVCEAIEVLHVALRVDPTVLGLVRLRVGTVLPRTGGSDACNVQFAIEALDGSDMRVLRDYVGPALLSGSDPTGRPSPAFERTKAELLRRLQATTTTARPRPKRRTTVLPSARVSFAIRSPSVPKVSELHVVHGFFDDLVGFVANVQRTQQARRPEQNEVDAPATTTCFKAQRIVVELRALPITHHVVQKTEELAALMAGDAPRVLKIQRLVLDPRLVACTATELRRFVRAIGRLTTANASAFHVDTDDADEGWLVAIDADGRDCSDALGDYLAALTQCRRLHILGIGALLAFYEQPRHRALIWRAVVASMISNASGSLDTLRIDGRVALTDDDADCVEALCAQGFSNACGVRTLVLDVKYSRRNGDPYPLAAELLTLLNGLETLTLQDQDRMATVGTVAAVLSRARTLRSLIVGCAHLASMTEVLDHTPALESLTLVDITLQDRNSFITLLQELATPTTRLATQLHTLKLLQTDGHCIRDMFALDTASLRLLERVLRVNRVLRDVSVLVSPSAETALCALLTNHTHDLVAPNAGETKAYTTTKTAFLSVVRAAANSVRQQALAHLDALAIERVFGFCAPSITRRVETHVLVEIADAL